MNAAPVWRNVLSRTSLIACLAATAYADAASTEGFYRPSDRATVLMALPDTEAPQRVPSLSELEDRITTARQRGDTAAVRQAARWLDEIIDEQARSPQAAALRAATLSYTHEFAAALDVLNDAINRHPGDAQLRLARASLHSTRGELMLAQADCRRLLSYAPAIAAGCLAEAQMLVSSDAQRSSMLTLLEQFSVQAQQTNQATVAAWLVGLRAETLLRAKMPQAALDVLAGQKTRDDVALLAIQSRAWLAADMPERVIDAIPPDPASDQLALLRALALETLGQQRQAGDRQATIVGLQARFGAASDDDGHLRERAWMQLDLLQQADAALASAATNFARQREAIDAELLLRSAVAAGQPESARPVTDWMVAQGITDAALLSLAEQLP